MTLFVHETHHVAGRAEDEFEAASRDYVGLARRVYGPGLERSGFLEMQGAFRAAFGTHGRAELVMMQKILDSDRLARLLTTEIPPERRAPGTWMHDALDVRDRWE